MGYPGLGLVVTFSRGPGLGLVFVSDTLFLGLFLGFWSILRVLLSTRFGCHLWSNSGFCPFWSFLVIFGDF